MKLKIILTLAILPVISMESHAQSSVTLYGLIDEGVSYISNAGGHAQWQLTSGNFAGSRWGIKGNEDLGGGWNTIFTLENGFNASKGTLGQGGREFGRQAFVGMSNSAYGSLTLGRQMDASLDLWSSFTGPGAIVGDLGSHPFDNDNADYDYRVNNTIKYLSPKVGGLRVEATYSLSNSTDFADNRLYSAAATYAFGPVSGALAYVKIDNGGSSTNSNGALVSDFLFNASSEQHVNAALKYQFANRSYVSLAYSHTDVYALPDGTIRSNVTSATVSGQDSWKFDNIDLNGKYALAPDIWLGMSYVFTHGVAHSFTGQRSANWNIGSFIADYDLSKRTSVYAAVGYQHVSSNYGAFGSGASIEGYGPSSSQNQAFARLAMLHRF